MRGANGDGRAVDSTTLETINAAATAIVSAENRLPPPTVQKRRWRSWLSIIGCFGYSKNQKRIGHAVLVPEAPRPGADAAAATAANPTQAPTITLPFFAPPSSPASLLQSEPPSVAHSPVGMISVTSVLASMYSPGSRASIFAIGPYAHETQLVSPPVFSTFTTEPSTAPFTPPSEFVHLTTPSSPEVPFAQLLHLNLGNGEEYQKSQVSHFDLLSYQLHPGSPVGQLISPRSDTSSPLVDYDKMSAYENQSQGSGYLTPDAANSTSQGCFLPNNWVSEIRLQSHPRSNRQNRKISNHRVSIELFAQEVLTCEGKKPVASTKAISESRNEVATQKEKNTRDNGADDKFLVAESFNDAPHKNTLDEDNEARIHQKDQSFTLASAKEFNFDNADGGDSHRPNIVADWWANEKLVGKAGGPSKSWSFFPVIQPGVS